MWSERVDAVAGGKRYELLRSGAGISFAELFELLESDGGFRAWYTELLASSEYTAFYWEHPPLSNATRDRVAEFVLLDGPSLDGLKPDPEPFRSQLSRHPNDDIATFPNLGGDAVLVVPCPIGESAAYAHLAAFLRAGPSDQVHDLWRRTARAVRESLGAKPMWLSTAGLGVAWLHIRLDSHPKYYRFDGYRRAS